MPADTVGKWSRANRPLLVSAYSARFRFEFDSAFPPLMVFLGLWADNPPFTSRPLELLTSITPTWEAAATHNGPPFSVQRTDPDPARSVRQQSCKPLGTGWPSVVLAIGAVSARLAAVASMRRPAKAAKGTTAEKVQADPCHSLRRSDAREDKRNAAGILGVVSKWQVPDRFTTGPGLKTACK